MIYNLIVTFNRCGDLRDTVSKLVELGFSNLIIVDNCSTDDTELVANEFRNSFSIFHYVCLPKNVGGAGGFSEGIRLFYALSNVGDKLLIHDDDSYPLFSVDKLGNYTAPMVTFPVVTEAGSIHPMNRPGLLFPLRSFKGFMSLRKARRPRDLEHFANFDHFDYASFVGLLIDRSVFDLVGTVSPEFFIYSDDTFYTSWCSRSGIEIAAGNLDDKFFHLSPRSSGSNLISGKFSYFEIKNKIIFLREFSFFPALYIFVWLLINLRSILSSFKFSHLSAIFSGLLADRSKFYPIRVSK